MYCGSRLWVLLQARVVLCEMRTECHVDLLVFKAAHCVLPSRAYRISPKQKLNMDGTERVACGSYTQADQPH